MPKQKPFAWDDYVKVVPYRKVLEGMESTRLIMPTMFSPDRREVYLRSQDTTIGTDDIKRLKCFWGMIYRQLRLVLATMNWSCEEAYLLQVDYVIVWSLLYQFDALPDDYMFPEYYLRKAWQKMRPAQKNISVVVEEKEHGRHNKD